MSSPERIAERTAASYSEAAGGYDDFYCSSAADLADSDVVFARARSFAPERGLFVDLGCGPGTALRWNVVPPQASYRGLDPAAGAIELAGKRFPEHQFRVGDHRNLPLGCAFVLGGFGPLMHVFDLDEFSRILEQRLRPGGRFLVMADPEGRPVRIFRRPVPTYAWHAGELQRAFSWADPRVYGHRRFVPEGWPRRLQRWLLRLERFVCGYGLDPDRCMYIVVEGSKPVGEGEEEWAP